MDKQKTLARQITKEREAVRTQLIRMADRKMNGFWASSEVSSGDPEDLPEQAQQELLKEQETRAYELLTSRAKALDQVWKSFQRGTYGVCRLCEKQIPWKRLKAVPTATLCVACQETVE